MQNKTSKQSCLNIRNRGLCKKSEKQLFDCEQCTFFRQKIHARQKRRKKLLLRCPKTRSIKQRGVEEVKRTGEYSVAKRETKGNNRSDFCSDNCGIAKADGRYSAGTDTFVCEGFQKFCSSTEFTFRSAKHQRSRGSSLVFSFWN